MQSRRVAFLPLMEFAGGGRWRLRGSEGLWSGGEAWWWLLERGRGYVSGVLFSTMSGIWNLGFSGIYEMDASRWELTSVSVQNPSLEAPLRGSGPTLLCLRRTERPARTGWGPHSRALTPSTSVEEKNLKTCGTFPTLWERIKPNLIL